VKFLILQPSTNEMGGAEVGVGVSLLSRIAGRWRAGLHIPLTLFHAICECFITIPLNLAVLRQQSDGTWEILMLPREKDDPYYPPKKWPFHMPGCVMLPGQGDPLNQLMSMAVRELGVSLIADRIRLVDSVYTPMGSRSGQNPRGDELTQLYVMFVDADETKLDSKGRWIPIGRLTNDPRRMRQVLPEQRVQISRLEQWLCVRRRIQAALEGIRGVHSIGAAPEVLADIAAMYKITD
jgi:hypothetical protein